ncbi:MAG TPA: response regulator transcription factor [Chryseolinea sp.]|nr:response regulator transcription factor [Chryseolinea sp.]HPH46943.1 response regulator transcription factor [Chryseolinea sp.]HPM29897.1 response regulator transcription factor [Chryseolinea sp.]
MKKIDILLVEDEALLREGLKSLLIQESFVESIAEAATLAEFSSAILKPLDLILMDIRLTGTNGLQLLELVRSKGVNVKVIAVTGLEGVELMINLLKAGVEGIVFKLDGYQEIVKTIRKVLENESYFPEKIMKIIQTNASRWDKVPPVLLNHTENELLKAIASGLTTKEIAALMKMGESTTETYRIRLIKKLAVANTAALLAYAYRNGIL